MLVKFYKTPNRQTDNRGYQRGHNNSGRAFTDLLRTEAGIELAIHAMRKVFEDNDTEAILYIIDAENAFNNRNRKGLL